MTITFDSRPMLRESCISVIADRRDWLIEAGDANRLCRTLQAGSQVEVELLETGAVKRARLVRVVKV